MTLIQFELLYDIVSIETDELVTSVLQLRYYCAAIV